MMVLHNRFEGAEAAAPVPVSRRMGTVLAGRLSPAYGSQII